MEYIGRCDFQIKINGYRIETGEVQSQILKYPNIKDCYVIDMQIKNNKELCAYYVENKHVDIDDLISTLDKKLPNYMIPKHFIKMGSLPMTVNGKINRKELPLPTIKRKVAIVKPANTIEELLCNIFCKVLEIEEISTVENIFNYYVDSLSLIKIQTILYSEGYNLDTQDFYNNKTIKSLADKIINGSASEEDYAENFKDVNFSISDLQKDITTNINFKNIFLFGATGFLGIHILHELLLNTNSNIYCLIRRKNGSIPRQRLEEKLKFYFSNENLEKYKDRIIILEGNLLDEHFGLDKVVYNKLIRDIDICIHSAALVKHYGDYNLFHQTNVVSTEKIIDFCNEGHSVLEYISTISVSGYGLVNTPDTTFTENNLYIGQNYKENVYVHSKFEAEYLIIEACKNTNLIASIYRVGNLSNRYTDGVFQENAYENSSLNRIIACINLNCYPKEFQTFPLEFSPVDICAHNIVKLLPDQNKNLNIYHLYNNNVTNFLNIQHLLEKNNIYLKAISSEDFKKLLIEQSNNYFGFANIINNKVTSNLNISNEYTDSILKKLNLNWPIIDDLYIQKIIDYLIKNKFIGEKTNETRKE
ncbi:MAG: SDR family oxidoreductase [Clostridia bacterium]